MNQKFIVFSSLIFLVGTCYPLAVPENQEAAIIHTVVATDLDEGQNGDIIYTITGKIHIEFLVSECISKWQTCFSLFCRWKFR